MRAHDDCYIDGAWTPSADDGRIAVIDPAREATLATIPAGCPADAERAIAAARRAFPTWSRTALEERAALLQALHDELARRADALAETITREMGSPLGFSRRAQIGLALGDLRATIAAAAHAAAEEEIGAALVVREPAGVVGAITPWNFPLHQLAAKVAPALAAGCTVVCKPSELSTLSALGFAEAVDAVGFPAGVFNLVCGTGPRVGETLAASPDVDVVTFTGSTGVGRRIAALAADTVKRVTLELGGKSANVVLDDAPLEQAIPSAVGQCIVNSGQVCAALSRLLVPRARLAEVEELAVAAVEDWTVGDPLAEGTRLGPVVSRRQRDTVRAHIARAIADGARVLAGGPEPPAGLERGFYVQPTILADVTPEMAIAREEVFGPVLAILAYEDEADAIRIANDTPYGLSGGVWSADPERAERVARELRTGHVVINGASLSVDAPFGGRGLSGLGRELGRYGLDEFLEIKTIQRS